MAVTFVDRGLATATLWAFVRIHRALSSLSTSLYFNATFFVISLTLSPSPAHSNVVVNSHSHESRIMDSPKPFTWDADDERMWRKAIEDSGSSIPLLEELLGLDIGLDDLQSTEPFLNPVENVHEEHLEQ